MFHSGAVYLVLGYQDPRTELKKPQITVLNVGTEIQPSHSISNSSKLRTRSDSNETYIKRSPLKKQFQKCRSCCGEMRRKHANFCEYEYACI